MTGAITPFPPASPDASASDRGAPSRGPLYTLGAARRIGRRVSPAHETPAPVRRPWPLASRSVKGESLAKRAAGMGGARLGSSRDAKKHRPSRSRRGRRREGRSKRRDGRSSQGAGRSALYIRCKGRRATRAPARRTRAKWQSAPERALAARRVSPAAKTAPPRHPRR